MSTGIGDLDVVPLTVLRAMRKHPRIQLSIDNRI